MAKRKKAATSSKKNVVPLKILEKRLTRLNGIVKKRGGKSL